MTCMRTKQRAIILSKLTPENILLLAQTTIKVKFAREFGCKPAMCVYKGFRTQN